MPTETMVQIVSFADLEHAVDMTEGKDVEQKPQTQTERPANFFRKLLKASWIRSIKLEDLFPLALLYPFLFLPAPLRGLVLILMTLVVISIVLNLWIRSRDKKN